MEKVWCRLCASMFKNEEVDADDLSSTYQLCCNSHPNDIDLRNPVECDYYEKFEINNPTN